jgi:subtilisin family serine protease
MISHSRNISLSIVLFIAAVIGMTGPDLLSAFTAEASSPPKTEQIIRMQGDRITIDVHNAAIGEILREIARKSGIAIAVGDGISGEISIKLTDVSLQEALETLCRNRALVYEYLPETKTYRIVRALTVGSSDSKNPAASISTTAREGSTVTDREAAGKETQTAVQENRDRTNKDGQVIPGETDARGRPRFKKGELLVRFKPGATKTQIEELHRSLQSTVLRESPKMRLQRIRLCEGQTEQEAMALYKASAIVEHAGRVPFRYLYKTANDPSTGLQWGLTMIKAPEAWDITTGKQEVIIAVIDTGVDYRHPDLRDNIWTNAAELNGVPGVDDDGNGYVDDIRGYDFADGDNDPMDTDGHGTHVSGIIAAMGNNGLGIAGINWKTRIMPLKIQSDDGEMTPDSEVDAIQYAIDQGARIINCSFGGPDKEDNEEDAFRALKVKDILAACAAGNNTEDYPNPSTPIYPASYNLDNIISVAASDPSDLLVSSSKHGKPHVDLMAPGKEIYSTIPWAGALVWVDGAHPTTYTATGMEHAGYTGQAGITGKLYSCGLGNPGEFPIGVNGNIALILRGDLNFSEKVQNAQSVGARGVIIYNNVVDSLDTNGGSLGSSGNWVPAVSITKAAGEALIALGNPSVTLLNEPVNTSYAYMNGTSMAAPHVAGTAGLLLSRCPSLSYEKIKSAILNSVDKIDSVSQKLVSGGRLNAFAAFKGIFPAGDVDSDCEVGLDDAILAVQVLTRLSPSLCSACSREDIGEDGKIGLQEVIYILQTVAGLR